MKAMVLAAGKGTRLGDLTRSVPKPLLPVAGRPLLSYTLALLADAGVTEVVVNLHHLAAQVQERLGDGSRWGLSVRYSYEETLLGTAGAVRRAADAFSESFLVVYGDNFLDFNVAHLVRAHQARQAAATIGLYQAPDPAATGRVESDPSGRVLRFVEKPDRGQITAGWSNTGVYVLHPALLATIPPVGLVDFGHDMFPRWLAAGERIYAEPLGGLVQDIGTSAGYQAAREALERGRAPRLSALVEAGKVA
jgi:NDP-sugar pyrophosphorylase family protein